MCKPLNDWDITKIRTRLLGRLACCLRSLNSLRDFALGSIRWRSALNRFLFLAAEMPVVYEAVSLCELRGCIGDMAGKQEVVSGLDFPCYEDENDRMMSK
jgi:hypothetical protein